MSDGYLSDVVFTSTYNRIHNPVYLTYIANLHGAGRNFSARFGYCDLGCGDGTTLNILAAMFPKAEFTGVDLNEEHIRIARETAKRAGLRNITFHNASFSELAGLGVGKRDYISCLGAFSWISEQLQDDVLDFVSDRLSDNGIFVVEYTASPGKVQVDALWRLMRVTTAGAASGAAGRARKGLQLIGELLKANADFFTQNPVARHVAEQLDASGINNLAHNSLTDFKAMDHSSVAARLSARAFNYRGSGLLIDNFEPLTIPARFDDMLSGYDEEAVRETVKDFIVNRGVRYDMYQRTAATGDVTARYDGMCFCRSMLSDRSPGKMTFQSGMSVDFSQAIYARILTTVQGVPVCFEEIRDRLAPHVKSDAMVSSALDMLVAADILMPCTCDSRSIDSQASNMELAYRISMQLIEKHVGENNMVFIPSAIIGQCVPVSPVMCLFLWAQFVVRADDLVTKILERYASSQYPVTVANHMVKDEAQMRFLLTQAEVSYRRLFLPWLLGMGVVVKA